MKKIMRWPTLRNTMDMFKKYNSKDSEENYIYDCIYVERAYNTGEFYIGYIIERALEITSESELQEYAIEVPGQLKRRYQKLRTSDIGNPQFARWISILYYYGIELSKLPCTKNDPAKVFWLPEDYVIYFSARNDRQKGFAYYKISGLLYGIDQFLSDYFDEQ